MEREDLLRHLAAWRDGIDPASGTCLPPDHPAQRTDFLRIVCAAIDALVPSPTPTQAARATRTIPTEAGRANAGRPWSEAEDALLEQAHGAGMGIAELARAHERTPGAITARLVKLGCIELPAGMRLRGMPAPASTPSP
jgi:hypothetical protein